jgi:ferredoxin
VHGYVYGRWPYLYIGVATGEHPLTRFIAPIAIWLSRLLLIPPREDEGDPPTFAESYHGKVVPLDAATQLVTVNQEIELRDLEQIIPFPQARDIVLKNPDHIVVIECPCRSVRENPCEPLDVCLLVGEPFASFVLEHHHDRARQIKSDEAVEILRGVQERGHVSHAFFKDAMLNRFYAICNCCSCCGGAMNAWRNGTPMLISSGYVGQVAEDLCVACGTCVDHCQFGALSLEDVAVVDAELCMGCGVCVSMCAEGACSLLRDPSRGEPLEIQQLIAEAAGAGLTP